MTDSEIIRKQELRERILTTVLCAYTLDSIDVIAKTKEYVDYIENGKKENREN